MSNDKPSKFKAGDKVQRTYGEFKGMKVVTKEQEFIILSGCQHMYNSQTLFAVNPELNSYSWDYDMETLLSEAVEIFIPNHPYDIFYNHSGWESIWKKEPSKTEAQLKLEELEQTIADAQRQIEQLKALN